SFVLMLLLGMAIAAQLPVVVMLLGWIGMVTPEFLRKNRRYALFLTAVAAAVITPTGDPFSLLLLWVPLYGLYELGLILLVLAPAHAVAEGRVISRIWRRSGSDKSGNRASKSTRTSQMNRPVARGSSSEDEANRRTDAEEGDE
ncbi:MAG TPA: twin-arginine translocase subunit TatC, partial [Phycisphaerales bacterium]|nr:twin-arginine translocase subunit TatC [Phycisphaerales bacterium]